MKTFQFTEKALIRIKLHNLPQYVIAQKVGLSPDLLSKWMTGQKNPPFDDPRLKSIAEILGLPFEEILQLIEVPNE